MIASITKINIVIMKLHIGVSIHNIMHICHLIKKKLKIVLLQYRIEYK